MSASAAATSALCAACGRPLPDQPLPVRSPGITRAKERIVIAPEGR